MDCGNGKEGKKVMWLDAIRKIEQIYAAPEFFLDMEKDAEFKEEVYANIYRFRNRDYDDFNSVLELLKSNILMSVYETKRGPISICIPLADTDHSDGILIYYEEGDQP